MLKLILATSKLPCHRNVMTTKLAKRGSREVRLWNRVVDGPMTGERMERLITTPRASLARVNPFPLDIPSSRFSNLSGSCTRYV
jgi:hypothetical protein